MKKEEDKQGRECGRATFDYLWSIIGNHHSIVGYSYNCKHHHHHNGTHRLETRAKLEHIPSHGL